MLNSLSPDQVRRVSSGLILVQTVCKGYQQTTLVDKEFVLFTSDVHIRKRCRSSPVCTCVFFRLQHVFWMDNLYHRRCTVDVWCISVLGISSCEFLRDQHAVLGWFSIFVEVMTIQSIIKVATCTPIVYL